MLTHAPSILAPLRQVINDQDSLGRKAAVKAIGNLQPIEAPSLTLLRNDCKEQDSLGRKVAVKALDKIPTEQYIDRY